jgi:hypothetical protein
MSECWYCKYYETGTSLLYYKCKAYPRTNSIPKEIYNNEAKHDKVMEGQVGEYIFERKKTINYSSIKMKWLLLIIWITFFIVLGLYFYFPPSRFGIANSLNWVKFIRVYGDKLIGILFLAGFLLYIEMEGKGAFKKDKKAVKNEYRK